MENVITIFRQPGTGRCNLSWIFLILLIVVASSSMNMKCEETLIGCTFNSCIPIPEHFREEKNLFLLQSSDYGFCLTCSLLVTLPSDMKLEQSLMLWILYEPNIIEEMV